MWSLLIHARAAAAATKAVKWQVMKILRQNGCEL